jgi:4-amino-4-deoxy-L-arabinose transferase-like glycosyltransferase
MSSTATRSHHIRSLLILILLVGAILRFVPIWFGLPFDRARPDEETSIGHASAVLAGDPNPHFFDWPSLTFYLFAAAFSAASTIHRLLGLDPALTVNEQFLVARGVVAFAGTATIGALFALTRTAAGGTTALVAAFFLTVATLHVRESHFAMTDVLMTLFVTTALALLVRTTRARSDTWSAIRLFVAAGLAGGLAASTKYSGVAIVAAFAAAQYAWARDTGQIALRSRLWTPSLACAVAFVCGFVVMTPYAVLDYGSFASGVAFDVTHLSTGHAGPDLGRGWSAHLTRSLPTAVGAPVFVAAILGAIPMTRLYPRTTLVAGAFTVALYALLAPGRTVFFRYVLPLVPVICLFAAVAVHRAAEWLARRARVASGAIVAAVAIAAALPALVNSVWLDVLLARTDTRVLAGRWLAERVKPDESLYDAGGAYAGSSLIGVSVHRWSADTYDPASNAFRNSGGRLPEWLVLPESPLVYGSVPPALRRLAAEKYQLVETAAATLMQQSSAVYDDQDAFFLPMSGFTAIIRPGPTIRIYRRADLPPS